MKIEDKIREVLPQLNELTKGCLIKESDSIKEVILRYKWDFIDTYSKERIIETFDIRKPTFEIIGHPVMLNDVLEYLLYVRLYSPEDKQIIRVLNIWNFSSVFLADQNEKLKEFLNNL